MRTLFDVIDMNRHVRGHASVKLSEVDNKIDRIQRLCARASKLQASLDASLKELNAPLCAAAGVYLPLRYRIRRALHHGPLDLQELVVRTRGRLDSVERVLRRYSDQFERVRVGHRVIVALRD